MRCFFSHPTAAAFADQESVDALLGVQRAEYERRMRERPPTLVHADLRADNLLFGPVGTPDEVIIIDWQLAIRGMGAFDIARLMARGELLYRQGRKAHTARAEVRYRSPVRVGETLDLKGWIDREKGRLVVLNGEARRRSDGVVVADCVSRFMLE